MLICFALICLGCNAQNATTPTGEGYIFALTDGGVLVLDNVDSNDMGKEWNDIFDTYQGDAIWLSTKKANLKVGQYVEYWVDGGINESFPRQATARKIEIVDK